METFEAIQYSRQIARDKAEGRIPIYEANWFEAHTRYCLDDCLRDVRSVGFNVLYSDFQLREKNKRKLFLMIARKE